MTHTPPHLDPRDPSEPEIHHDDYRGIGRQGPSKYGKGGRKAFRAKSRSKRAKK